MLKKTTLCLIIHAGSPFTNVSSQVVSLHNLLEAILIARRSRDIVSAMTLLQKVIEGLLDGLSQMPSDPDFMIR